MAEYAVQFGFIASGDTLDEVEDNAVRIMNQCGDRTYITDITLCDYRYPKSCGNCVWSDFEALSADPEDADRLGLCVYPTTRLPDSMQTANRERTAVVASGGSKCPCWKQRGGS